LILIHISNDKTFLKLEHILCSRTEFKSTSTLNSCPLTGNLILYLIVNSLNKNTNSLFLSSLSEYLFFIISARVAIYKYILHSIHLFMLSLNSTSYYKNLPTAISIFYSNGSLIPFY